MFATRKGLVKKTALSSYGRPKKGGIIAINLREGDELVDVASSSTGDEVVLATANGMAIRFSEADARPMGRRQRRERHRAGGGRPRGGDGRRRSGGHAAHRLPERLRQAHAVWTEQRAEARPPADDAAEVPRRAE